MSEKRFKIISDDIVLDNETKNCYWCVEYAQLKKLVDLLNEKEVRIKTLEKENKRLEKNLKTAKNNVDANFKSAQYWRQKFESIAEKHQEDLDRMNRKDVIQTKSRCQDCEYFHNFGEINICGHGITDRHVFKPEGLTKCSSWIMRTIKK